MKLPNWIGRLFEDAAASEARFAKAERQHKSEISNLRSAVFEAERAAADLRATNVKLNAKITTLQQRYDPNPNLISDGPNASYEILVADFNSKLKSLDEERQKAWRIVANQRDELAIYRVSCFDKERQFNLAVANLRDIFFK